MITLGCGIFTVHSTRKTVFTMSGFITDRKFASSQDPTLRHRSVFGALVDRLRGIDRAPKSLTELKAWMPPEVQAIERQHGLGPTEKPRFVFIDGVIHNYSITPSPDKPSCNTITVTPIGGQKPTFQMTTCG